MRKLSRGDRPVMSLATYNAFVDAARAHQARTVASGDVPFWLSTGLIRVQNGSGEHVPRFGVLAVTGPIVSPTDNEDGFLGQVALAGDAPASGDEGKFVILMEPAESGQIVRARAAGVSLARVEIANEDHGFADIKDGDATVLLSTDSGVAQMLWVQPEADRDPADVAWVVLRIGGAGGGATTGTFAIVTAKVGSEAPYRYACAEAEMDIDGVFTEKVDGALYSNVYVLDEQGSGGQGAAPVVIGDAVYILAAPGGVDAYVAIRGHFRGTY